jgi:hypothetical protein
MLHRSKEDVMSSFSHWFRKFPKVEEAFLFSQATEASWWRRMLRSRQRGNRRRPVRCKPVLEFMEERDLLSSGVPGVLFTSPSPPPPVPNLSGHELLASADVQLMFWGSYWDNNPLLGQIFNAVGNIVSGPYMNGLAQYGGIGHANLRPGVIIDHHFALPSSTDDVQNFVDNYAGETVQGYPVPEPDDDPEILYVVITPPGTAIPTNPPNGGAYHTDYTDFDLPDHREHDPFIWLAANNTGPSSSNQMDTVTYAFSHELAEAVTDPLPNADPALVWNGTTEIGDVCQPNSYRLNGYLINPYWSQADNACLAATGPATSQAQSFRVNGQTLTINGDQLTNLNDTITVASTSAGGIQVMLNGDTAQFDPGQITSITINPGAGTNTVNVETLPKGVTVTISDAANSHDTINLSPTAHNLGNLQSAVSISGNGQTSLNLFDQSGPANTVYEVAPGTIYRNSNLLVFDSQLSQVALHTSSASDTVQVDPGSSVPVIISTPLGDNITATVHVGAQLTLDNATDPANLNIAVTNNAVQYQSAVTISLKGIQGLTLNGGTGNTHFTVQSTGTAEPLTLNTGAGTNTVDVAAAASAVTIYGNGTDTVNIGSAQTLDGVAPVTVHGNGNTTLTLNDQNTHLPASYALTNGRVERDAHPTPSSTATTLFSYDHVKSLTLNASNNDANGGGNVVDIESTAVPTYVYGGTATTSISVDPTLKNLDNIGAYLRISGASSPVSVYDQADAHAASGTPIAYTVSDEGMTRTATINGSQVTTRIDTLPVQSVTLYTSQTKGSLPNTVNAGSYSAPVTLLSAAADAVNVSDLFGPLTVDAHGGTLTFDDRGLQNTYSPYTTDPQHTHGYTVTDYSLGYTVTDHTVGRSEHAHWVEVIDPVSGNSTGGQVVSAKDYYFNGTFSYQNVKSLTIAGSPVDSTFAVQSTPTGMPVVITGSTGSRVSVPGTPGGPTVNRFIVGLNGSVKSIHSQLTFNGSSAGDTIVVDDSQATLQDVVTMANGKSNDVQLGMAATDQFFGSGGGLDCTGMGSLTLNLSKAANDKVSLSPSAVTAFAIIANGTGAELDLDLTGVTNPQQTGTSSGKFTFGNRQAVSFQNFGTVHAH